MATIGLAGFNASWSKAVNNTKILSSNVAKAALKELFSNIIQSTPVDTGYLKGNWQVTFNSPAVGEIPTRDKSGSAAIGNAIYGLDRWDTKSQIYFSNMAPYASAIEYGWSTHKAPQGMVRINIARWSQIVDKMSKRYGQNK